MKILYSTIIILFCFVFPSYAQRDTTQVRDTLQAAVKTDSRSIFVAPGVKRLDPMDFSKMVSATGAGDAIKYIQTLPGVSTGIEGSSAYFVRGGNLGGNRVSIDGVPVYGCSHLMGFTSAYSPDMVEQLDFYVGGFPSEDSNFTDSHIAIKSKTGSFEKWSGNASISNFMVGGSAGGPIFKDRLSLLLALRASPINPEYELASDFLKKYLPKLEEFNALVGDVYAKLAYSINDSHIISLSTFHSIDNYHITYGNDNMMKWQNSIINLEWKNLRPSGSSTISIAYDYFANSQGQNIMFKGNMNNLSVNSSISEITARWLEKRDFGKYFHIQFGAGARKAYMNPYASAEPESEQTVSNPLDIAIYNANAQLEMSKTELFKLVGAFRGNIYTYKNMNKRDPVKVYPEFSLSGNYTPLEWLTIEATADWTYMFYHLLEGIPMGWSVDMMIPADERRGPESARQFYAGLLFSLGGGHSISVGGYDKKSKGLVYFEKAVELFSPSRATWESNVIQGKGSSRGLEFLYEKVGKVLDYRLAYTLSKTDRTFDGLNGNRPFPAKYDRTHILNFTTTATLCDNDRCSVSVNSLFTFQSGYWETVPDGHYHVYPLFGMTFQKYPHFIDPKQNMWYNVPNGEWLGYPEEYMEGIEINYYSGKINNFRMPDYIRWDIGCSFHFKSSKCPSTLNVGVYNVLNRHNPFVVIYDADQGKWRQVSLFPIMPSISYTIEF